MAIKLEGEGKALMAWPLGGFFLFFAASLSNETTSWPALWHEGGLGDGAEGEEADPVFGAADPVPELPRSQLATRLTAHQSSWKENL